MQIATKKTNITLEKKIATLMLILGFTILFLIPTWQIPDEYTHLKVIGDAIYNDNFASLLAESVNIDGSIMRNYDKKVNIQEVQSALSSSPVYDKTDMMPRGISLSIIRHLPSTLGILFGIILGVPAYWALQLGEIFSLMFYVCICYVALKIMPIKKEMFGMILLMPMAMQQAGGIGYDSVLMPLCFLWVAYIFYLKTSESICLKDFIYLLLLIGIITYIKMPYCFLILLVLILPIDKIHFHIGKYNIDGTEIKKYRFLLLGVAVIGAIAVVYLMRENYWIQLVLGLMKEWRRTLYLLEATGKTWSGFLITSSVGNFGWLDAPIIPAVAVIVYVILMITSVVNSDSQEAKILTRWDKMIVWGTWCVLCLFTALSMVNHTIMITLYGSESALETYDIHTALYQIPYIGGLQGRYFLPYICLLFLPLPQLKQVNKKRAWVALYIFEILLFAYIIYVLLARYWLV